MALTIKQKDELFQLRLKARLDTRTTACRVQVEPAGGRSVRITGFSHYRQTDAFIKTTAREIFGEDHVTFALKILERGNTPKFAIVTREVAPLWSLPDASDPEKLSTEALFGTIVRAYHRDGEFTFIQHPDGYLGYCPTSALKPTTTEEYLRWKNGTRAVTLVPLSSGQTLIPVGSRLPYENGHLHIPGADPVKVRRRDVVISDPADSKFITTLRQRAETFMESPYLWGGKSTIGIDCSGFVQTLMLQEGIFLPRDASQQCHVGEIVGYLPQLGDLLPGDVMFFMNKNGFVYHVGIYLGENTYMHSAGKTGPTISSILKTGENFMARYHGTFCYARRVHGCG